jgi:hypothetical protein
MDSFFGCDHHFLDSLPQGLVYFADIPNNHLVFTSYPEMSVPEYKGKGRRPSIPVPSFPPVDVSTIAADDSVPWNNVVLGTGSKGAIVVRDKCLRVVEARDGEPGKYVWLYIRELEDGSLKYALCNEPADASIEDIRKPALLRWSIEQSFKECKNHLGMDHYETRSWVGWRRHMLMTCIAQLFVLKMIHMFLAKKDQHLESPTVTAPVSLDKYKEVVEKHSNNQEYSCTNMSFEVKAPTPFLTFGVVIQFINGFFIKTGDLFQRLNALIKNNAESFTSHSKTKNEKIMAASSLS